MKRFLGIMLVVAIVLTATIGLASCSTRMDRYHAVVPTDTDYLATLKTINQNSMGNYVYEWKVMRKSADICDQQRTVIYVEYTFTDALAHSGDFERTLLYVEGKVLSLSESGWAPYTGSFGDKWSDIYGSYSVSGSFVYEMTQKINGRDFPVKFKKETSDFIEYKFDRDNEMFRISKDIYHLLLNYTFDYQDTHLKHEATFVLGTPADSILALDTITPEMLAD